MRPNDEEKEEPLYCPLNFLDRFKTVQISGRYI